MFCGRKRQQTSSRTKKQQQINWNKLPSLTRYGSDRINERSRLSVDLTVGEILRNCGSADEDLARRKGCEGRNVIQNLQIALK